MTAQIFGNIHSIESCGTVDGPGIRFVVFMQGCPLRCQYCHNPDSWSVEKNQQMTVDEILEKYDGVKEFVKSGGITVTGGEPLLQIDFVTELFSKAKEKNIHTALDTSGILFNPENTQKIDELLKYTDLVLLDIKHINNAEHIKLTGLPNENILKFAKYLSDKNIPVWGDIVCFLAMFTPFIGMILFGIGLFTTCKSDSDKNDEADKKENEEDF